jgi:hypothetical protein
MTNRKTTSSAHAQRSTRGGEATAKATRRTTELASASSRVIAKRTALGVAALSNPAAADIVEFSRLVPEKAKAATASASIFARRSLQMGGHIARIAADEIGFMARASGELTGCRSPQSVLAVQSGFAFDWLSRAVSHSLSAGDFLMRSGTAVLYPYHRAATRNARRLGV